MKKVWFKELPFKTLVPILMLGLAIGLLCFSNLKAALYNCFNVSDLGIYAQALYEVAGGESWNPFISVRGLKIFNDHFDPVVILIAPLTRLFDYHIGGVLLVELFWVFLTLGTMFFWLRKRYSWRKPEIWYCLLLLLGCKGLLSALTFPLHPTTWSLFPCTLVVMALWQNRLWPLVWSTIFLCLFREDFPFAVVGLALALGVRRDWRKAFAMAQVGCGFLIIDYYLRPRILGPTTDYGSEMLHLFFHSPFRYIGSALSHLSWNYFSQWYPFILPLFILIRREIPSWNKFFQHPLWALMGFLAPLFLIRLLAHAFYFHYNAPLVTTLWALICLSTVPQWAATHKRLAGIALLLFAISASSSYTKMIKILAAAPHSKCTFDRAKIPATAKLQHHLQTLSESQTLLATGGILPQILRPRRRYHHLGGMSVKLASYDWLLLEKNQSGDTWPLSAAEVEGVAQNCRPFARKIWQDDDFYLLLEGPIPRTCVEGKL